MNKIILIEQIEVGWNFLWWKNKGFDYLDIAEFKIPFGLSKKQFIKFQIIMAILIIPHFIYLLWGYKQITQFKIKQGHHFKEFDIVKCIYNEKGEVIEVLKDE